MSSSRPIAGAAGAAAGAAGAAGGDAPEAAAPEAAAPPAAIVSGVVCRADASITGTGTGFTPEEGVILAKNLVGTKVRLEHNLDVTDASVKSARVDPASKVRAIFSYSSIYIYGRLTNSLGRHRRYLDSEK